MTYTKGPWRWDNNFLFGADNEMLLYYTTNDDGIHLDNDADADLIAAAPELLKALQGAVHSAEVFRDSGDWSAVVDFDEWLAYSQEVIAKATQ